MWITKLYLKVLHQGSKRSFLTLISPQQTAYVENRSIGERGILIADIIEITDILNKEELLVTIDIKKFSFGNNFIKWIKTLISKQRSCIINGGNTAQYIHLERGAHQGDPISAYIFIFASEVLSFLVRNNKDI